MSVHLINKLPLNLSIHPRDRGELRPIVYFLLPNMIMAATSVKMDAVYGLAAPKSYPPFPPLLSLYLKSAPDSQLCNSVNDGCRCCWSAQVTTGQKNESNRCLPTVRFIHWHGNILHRRRSGSRTDGYACLQLLGPSYFCLSPTRPWWRYCYCVSVKESGIKNRQLAMRKSGGVIVNVLLRLWHVG